MRQQPCKIPYTYDPKGILKKANAGDYHLFPLKWASNPVIPYRNEPKGRPKETNEGDFHLFSWAPLSSKSPFSWIPLTYFFIFQLSTDPCSCSNLRNCPWIHAAAPIISHPCSARIVWKVYVGFTILGKDVNIRYWDWLKLRRNNKVVKFYAQITQPIAYIM